MKEPKYRNTPEEQLSEPAQRMLDAAIQVFNTDKAPLASLQELVDLRARILAQYNQLATTRKRGSGHA